MKQVLQDQLNQMTGNATGYDAQFGKNCSGWQSQEGYTLCTQAIPFGYYDKSNVLPYTVNYTLNTQWQPFNTLAIMLGYTGNRGRHSVIPIPFNEPGIATASNPIWGETSSYGMEVMDQNSSACDYDYCPIPKSHGPRPTPATRISVRRLSVTAPTLPPSRRWVFPLTTHLKHTLKTPFA